jgi:hypothetical protein
MIVGRAGRKYACTEFRLHWDHLQNSIRYPVITPIIHHPLLSYFHVRSYSSIQLFVCSVVCHGYIQGRLIRPESGHQFSTTPISNISHLPGNTWRHPQDMYFKECKVHTKCGEPSFPDNIQLCNLDIVSTLLNMNLKDLALHSRNTILHKDFPFL